MKHFLHLLLASVGLGSGSAQAEQLDPRAFTRVYVEALLKASPGLQVEVLRDLELKVTTADGRDITSFLNNAYDTYKQDPKAKDDLIQRYVASALETIGTAPAGVDRARIVPVIKDRQWLEEMRSALVSQGAKELPEHVFEDFSSDLVVFYAEDSPANIRYLGPKDLEAAKVQKAELRALAGENLLRLLPDIESHGSDGFYMITAGGDYEASLLLLDSIWSSGQLEVKGDVVVGIPTRDLLLVTGSQDAEGIEKLKRLVNDATNKGSYRLTQKLFVYRGGRFSEFTNID